MGLFKRLRELESEVKKLNDLEVKSSDNIKRIEVLEEYNLNLINDNKLVEFKKLIGLEVNVFTFKKDRNLWDSSRSENFNKELVNVQLRGSSFQLLFKNDIIDFLSVDTKVDEILISEVEKIK
jgi:hypothetical protein